MLIVFSGLPGVGKTIIARALAERLSGTYLRIDTIEQSLRNAKVLANDVGPAGYLVAQALAESNLAIGTIVVADCVNPVAESRSGWRSVAERAHAVLFDIEVICSDVLEHRRRVESRAADVQGLIVPNWDSATRHEYEPWATRRLVVDTALISVEDAVSMIVSYVGR